MTKPKTVFNLDEWIAEEPSAPPFTFTYAGQRWEWPGKFDLRIEWALRSGELDVALGALFGAEQWARFRVATAAGALTSEAAIELFRAHARHLSASKPTPSTSDPKRPGPAASTVRKVG